MRPGAAVGEGAFDTNPLETLEVIAVHPPGGCPMGDDASTGVVTARQWSAS
jgi:hypothetical protein